MYWNLGDVLQEMNAPISKKYGILMVATNDFVNLWVQTALSLQSALGTSANDFNIHLFTNKKDDCERLIFLENLKMSVEFHEIPGWGWPEATLLRYEFFDCISEELKEEILVYLDSDMHVRSNFLETLNPDEWKNGIALVIHPGYVRFKGFAGIWQRIQSPNLLIRDVLNSFLRKKTGDWESNEASEAFVPREKQKKYVHGAIWMGKNRNLKELISRLSQNTSYDLDRGIIAKWHDESHLNWFCSNFEVTILDSRYSGFYRYRYLKKIDSMIVSVEKEKDFGRKQSEIETR